MQNYIDLMNLQKICQKTFMLCLIIRNFAEQMKTVVCHIALLLMLVVCACSKSCPDYTVQCSFTSVKTDSVTLYVLEEDYGMMRDAGGAKVKGGKARLRGQLDAPVIAMLKMSGVEKPFYFILEPGLTTMEFGRDFTLVQAGALNHAYACYEQLREQLLQQRADNRKQYLKLAGDSTLTQAQEMKLMRKDSVLCDSVQRMTVTTINEGGLVGTLVRHQYAATLDSLHRTMLQKAK
jgi:hypothetical protein